ncbi:MAG: polyamine aminopropyltransferase [Candidatus Zixiibacteriota bacterium]|nr:MAG: polyamine aminopropyltransferase [candidate division Zixibacteria bacterium]
MPNHDWYIEKFQDASAIGYRITGRLYHAVSPYQTVEIYQTAEFGNLLVLDGAIMLTEAHEFIYHDMLVHIPLLSHPHPKRVLVIGGGDGGTIREVLRHDTVERADMVEIDEEVVKASRLHLPDLAGQLDDPRVRLKFQDAVEFVREISDEYDVVLVDSTDPIGPGEGLFSSAFYRDVLRALKADGIVAVQSESPFGTKGEVGAIQAKMKAIFPLVRLYWGPMPNYPFGTWTWTYCSKSGREPEIRRPEAAAAIEAEAKYYNRDIHRSAFVLPNFMRKY